MILALDLYQRSRLSQLSQRHPDVVELSQILSRLAIHANRPDADRFRNPNGVYMKLANFARFDPAYTGQGRSGLPHGSDADEDVWRDFSDDPDRLRRVANAIRMQVTAPTEDLAAVADDDHIEAPEGALLLRHHQVRERNATVIRKRKQLEIQRHGRLRCEVCSTDFAEVYGPLGHGYIECHHTVPLARTPATRITRLTDLAIVCPNCHRMLHRGGDLLSVAALRTVVQERLRRGAE